jgi:hypothetical protein
MSKDEFGGGTTSNLQCNIEKELVKAARMEKVRRDCWLRDLYHEAILEWIDTRVEADKWEVGELYMANPYTKNEDEKYQNLLVTVREDLADRLKTWADRDQRNYASATYSALSRYFQTLLE